MREGKKKVFLLCAVSAACLCFFGGCREEKQVKTDFETGFYSLTEAYENGWLTKADVKQISDYRGGAQSCPELDAAAEKRIREFAAAEKSTAEKLMTAEDFGIEKYFGTYNGSYAIILSDLTQTTVNEVTWEESPAGIKFFYADPTEIIKIYKEKN